MSHGAYWLDDATRGDRICVEKKNTDYTHTATRGLHHIIKSTMIPK